MQAIESIPVFRTRPAAPMPAAKEPAPVAPAADLAFTLADVDTLPIDPPMATQAAYDAHKDDLTSFVGLDVNDSAMGVLTGRAMAYGWQLEARRVPAGWHVYRLTAKP